jgi:uncharacterized protein (TIGR03083 family)
VTVEAVPQGDQIAVDLDPAAVLAAHARHRRRFAQEVAELDDVALATASRCHLWSVADVLRHVRDVDEWMQAIWTGGRPPFTSFDPIMTPHEFVLKGRAIPDAEARDRYVESCEVMAADVDASGPERWGVVSVSPVGFVPWWLSALHVFFDSWIHERDVLLPLGITPPVEDDEATAVLAYSFAIVGTLIKEPTDATLSGVHIVAGNEGSPSRATPLSAVVGTNAPDVIDALLGRGNIEQALAGSDPDVVRRFAALARIFSP